MYLSPYLCINLSIYLTIHQLIYLSTYLYICISVYISIYQSVCWSVCLYLAISLYLFIYLSIYLSICLSIYQSIYLSIYQFIYLSIHPSIYLPIYLLIFLFIYQCTFTHINGIVEWYVCDFMWNVIWRLLIENYVAENASESEKKNLLSELELMKQLKPHPNVIKLLGCVTKSGKYWNVYYQLGT